jgi:hypothetical protein
LHGAQEELRRIDVGNDTVLGETGTRPKPIAEQMFAVAAFIGTAAATTIRAATAMPAARTAAAGIAGSALSKKIGLRCRNEHDAECGDSRQVRDSQPIP